MHPSTSSSLLITPNTGCLRSQRPSQLVLPFLPFVPLGPGCQAPSHIHYGKSCLECPQRHFSALLRILSQASLASTSEKGLKTDCDLKPLILMLAPTAIIFWTSSVLALSQIITPFTIQSRHCPFGFCLDVAQHLDDATPAHDWAPHTLLH